MTYVDPFSLMLTGNFLQAMLAGYTNILGGWFYVMIGLLIITGVYLKTESPAAMGLAALVLGSMGTAGTFGQFLNLFPGAEVGTGNIAVGLVWILLVVIGITTIIYSIFKSK